MDQLLQLEPASLIQAQSESRPVLRHQNISHRQEALPSTLSIILSTSIMLALQLQTLLLLLVHEASASPLSAQSGHHSYQNSNLDEGSGFIGLINRSIRQGSPVGNRTNSLTIFDPTYAVSYNGVISLFKAILTLRIRSSRKRS